MNDTTINIRPIAVIDSDVIPPIVEKLTPKIILTIIPITRIIIPNINLKNGGVKNSFIRFPLLSG